MKIAIVNDVHFGARSDSEVIAEHQAKFWRDVFFPRCMDEGVGAILVLGDLMERRKYVNYKTLLHLRRSLIDPASAAGIPLHITVGNHDVYHRSTNALNSPMMLLSDHVNVVLYDVNAPTEIKFSENGVLVGLVPWITEDNFEVCGDFIKTTTASHLFGHFEINDFEMMPGHVMKDGMPQSAFSRFDLVLSGHYHGKSSRNKIHYLGTQFDMDWSDYGQTKGFHIFDDVTGTLEYCINPYTIFVKVYWDNGTSIEPADLAGKFVKLIVRNKTNEYDFQKYHDAVIAAKPADIAVIELNAAETSDLSEAMDTRLLSTVEVLEKHAALLETEEAVKSNVSSMLRLLYQEALTRATV